MHLAASQRYQQTWPLSELPLVRPISDSSVYKRASAGRAFPPSRPPILKFHSDRRKRGERRRENERIAEQANLFESSWFIRAFKRWASDRSFPPTYGLIFALILGDFVRGVPGTRSIVRFNGLFFRRPWIYYGKLEESIMGRVRGCLVENIYNRYIYTHTHTPTRIQLKENTSYVFILPQVHKWHIILQFVLAYLS